MFNIYKYKYKYIFMAQLPLLTTLEVTDAGSAEGYCFISYDARRNQNLRLPICNY